MKAKRDGVTSQKSMEEAESALTDTCLITTSVCKPIETKGKMPDIWIKPKFDLPV